MNVLLTARICSRRVNMSVHPTPPSSSSAAATRFLVVVVFFGLAALLLPPISTFPTTTLSAVGFGALIATLMVLDREVITLPFSPLALAGIFWFVGYALRGMVVGLTGRSNLLERVLGSPYDQLPWALLLSAISLPLLWLGYKLPFGRAIAKTLPYVSFPGTTHRTMSQWYVRLYLLYAVGWIGRFALWTFGSFHHSTMRTLDVSVYSWLQMLADFSWLSLWTLFRFKHERGDHLFTFVPWFVVEFINGIIDGGRSKMAWAVVIFAVTRNQFSARPYRWRTIIAFLVVSGGVIFPALTIFRQTYYAVTHEQGGPGVREAMQAVGSWDEAFQGGALWQQREGVGDRFAMLDVVAVVLDRVPGYYPHALGDTFIPPTLVAPIPRFLWPGKPVYAIGRRFNRMFHDAHASSKTSVYLGIAAEFFYNFGWLGLGLMLLVGVWIRLHWERYLRYTSIHRGAAARFSYNWTLALPTATLVSYIGGLGRRFFDLYVYFVALEGLPRRYRLDASEPTDTPK